MRKTLLGSLGLLAVVGALVFALGAAAKPSATTVTVAAGKPRELAFALSARSVPKGTVVFKVANRGVLEHDFKIAGKKTPVLAKGKTATLKVTFKKAGRYPFICTVPGHAAGGMKGTLVVK